MSPRASLMALMAGLSIATARAADDPAGYLVSAQDGAPVTSAYGACLRTSEWSPEHAYRGCGPVPFTVSIDALFPFDSAALTPQAAEALDALAQHLVQAHTRSVDIVGHADGIGHPAYNRRLSEQRARTVRDYLAARGVDFHTRKDQVIFEKDEVLTGTGTLFSVFTPYKNAWLKKLAPFYVQSYPVRKYASRLAPASSAMPLLQDLGFEQTGLSLKGGMAAGHALPSPFESLGGWRLRA